MVQAKPTVVIHSDAAVRLAGVTGVAAGAGALAGWFMFGKTGALALGLGVPAVLFFGLYSAIKGMQ